MFLRFLKKCDFFPLNSYSQPLSRVPLVTLVSVLYFLLNVLFPLFPSLLPFNFLMLNQKALEVRSCRLCLSHEGTIVAPDVQ